MSRREAHIGPPAPARLLQAVRAEVADAASAWFPDLDGGRLQVRARPTAARPRCYLYEVDLEGARSRHTIVLKVRHSVPALRRRDRFEERPVLAPQRTLPDEETARREYDGLRAVSAALSSHAGERFGVLRPLALMPGHAAILMDYVTHPTLRERVLASSRLTWRHAPPLADEPWANAGAWLRIFHDHAGGVDLEERVRTREEVAGLYDAYAEFLIRRGSTSPLLPELRRCAGELAGVALPRTLPLAAGHGDFVDSNMFLAPSGQVTVFDPLPLWRVPRYQDLATFVVGLRTHALQTASQGLAFAEADLVRYERALLAGYFGSEVPVAAVRAYELLVVLDRWATMVSKRARHRGGRLVVHSARRRLALRHVEEEARRLHAGLTD